MIRSLACCPPQAAAVAHTCATNIDAAQATSSRLSYSQNMRRAAATAPHPRHEDLPAPPQPADMPPVTRPEHHRPQAPRALRPRHPHRPSRRRVLIDRQRARPYDRHGESPPPIPSREGTQTRREGITTSGNRFTTILNRAGEPRSPHHQRTQPEHSRTSSANQAANTMPASG